VYSFNKMRKSSSAIANKQAKTTPNIGQQHHLMETLQRTIGNRGTMRLLTNNNQVIQRNLDEESKSLVKGELIDFYNSKKQSKAKYDTLFMPQANELAKKYSLPKEDIRKYYKELLSTELEPPVVTIPVNNGVLSLSAIGKSPFTGTTAGQSYINSSDYMGYENHISVSYIPDAIKRTATITGLHVSFKDDSNEVRFWYYVNSGQITYRGDNNPTGARGLGAVLIGQLNVKADSLINSKLGVLKCTY
jgi:hypothetical protein